MTVTAEAEPVMGDRSQEAPKTLRCDQAMD